MKIPHSLMMFGLLILPGVVLSKENQTGKRHKVSSLKVTCLSTMLADRGIGEWGYAALVEVDGQKILFDTGNRPDTVLKNAETLGVDLTDVTHVFLSHNHRDHAGGLVALRKTMSKHNPKAFSKVHVGKGIFSDRVRKRNQILEVKAQYEATGGEFVIHTKEHQLFPGVWITGPIERIHPERNWGGSGKINTAQGQVEDNIPEDQSLVIDTEQGFVLISGCGHAGMINTMEHITSKIHPGKITTAIGGFHLVRATDEHLAWTAKKLKAFGVSKLIGAHCTGIHALYTLKDLMKWSRSDAVVGSVGDSFELTSGINAGYIAR
ncbi:MBL fold metallo-hydrolase [Sulfidibacter corallicola]|uniref:MBL fold metallo-hydrolase n=1 Tax=Sulfidibacter corallicola TaxID=2818388 RepID=A0A8A4TKH9_SULCO|nr:MBL fold metallo-hydrolase [Sulfidibacter corallicola]QTD50050.1 MBL fold metallo-hydrolase [Sulfidibacter corallicola]